MLPPRGDDRAGPAPDAVLAVPEIRDYRLINEELARLLGEGAGRVVLYGVEGQRLLAAGLRGPWAATIVVDGPAGPELASGLEAPGVTILALGDVADGAGLGLAAGRIEVVGNASDGLGYAQRGGTIVVRGDAGHRAGLMQGGGLAVVLGRVGRLAGERQRGGVFVAGRDRVGPHAGLGRLGGRLVLLDEIASIAARSLPSLESAFLGGG